jgi:hypothetical protein
MRAICISTACRRRRALRALSGEVIFVGSFSKKLIPALRIGFVVCPKELRPRIDSLKHSMDLCTSALLQLALAEFIERGYLAAHLTRVIPEYRDRRDALTGSLSKHMPDGVTWRVPQHGLHLWLQLPPSVDADRFHDEARRRDVVVNPGAFHSPNNTRRDGVRLTYCSEPSDRLVLAGGDSAGCACRARERGCRPHDARHHLANLHREEEDMDKGTRVTKVGLAEMLKGGVIMDVVDATQARIAEEAGAVAVMALERVPAQIRKEAASRGRAIRRMIRAIQDAVSIP